MGQIALKNGILLVLFTWYVTTQQTISRVITVQKTSSKNLKHVYQTRVRLEILLAPFLVYLSCFELVFCLVISV